MRYAKYFTDLPWVAEIEAKESLDENYIGNLLAKVKCDSLETTEDCVEIIEKTLGKGNWKRVLKDCYGERFFAVVYRTFVNKDNGKAVTIYLDNEGYDCLYACLLDFDLRLYQDAIEKIVKFCKHYIGYDYGGIYFNPIKKSVFLKLSDGFISWIENPKDKNEIEKLKNDSADASWTEDINKTPLILDEVDECSFGDEFSPSSIYGFIYIGNCSTFE
jgi:hypothetical protein